MELADEIVINAPKERVYAALNDPEILQQCIPVSYTHLTLPTKA